MVGVAGALAVVIGLFMLAAWFSGAAARWSAAGAITVKTNMALGLVLAGASLGLLGLRLESRSCRHVGMAAAAVILLLGGLTLVEHLTGWDLGIDQLLAREPPGAVATASPNRMGPPGSSSHTLLGAALLLLGTGRRRGVPYLGLAVILINLVPAVGFLYGIDEFFTRRAAGIAWPTVVAMIALGLGLVASCPEGGPMPLLLRDDAGGALLRRLLPAALLLPLGLGFLCRLGQARGLYDTAMGAGLFALAMMLIFSLLLWRGAGRLSRADAERKRGEEARRESDHRLRTTLEASAMGTFQVDLVTGEGQWNDVEFRLLGLRPGEAPASPETFFRFVHPDDVQALRAEWQEATRTGKLDAEFRIVRADGQERWLVGKGQFAFAHPSGAAAEGGGRPLRFQGLNYDVTDRRRAEEALRRAGELGEALNRISGILHSTLDSGQIIQRLVAEGAAALGSDTAAISLRDGDGWTPICVHGMPDGILGVRMTDDQEQHAVLAIRSRQPVAVADAFNDERFNREHLRRHGVRSVLAVPLIVRDEPFGVLFFNYHAATHAFTDAEVNFARRLGSTAASAIENARLFDQRQRAEAALRASESRYRTLFNEMDEGYCIIEMLYDGGGRPDDWRFIEVNPAFGKHSGLAEATGRTVRELAPAMEARWFERYGEVARTGRAVRFVDRSEALDGRWFDAYAFRVGEPGQHRVAVLFTDITARRRVEEERDAALRATEQAKAAAESASRAKDQFIAVLSHELRTPLTPAVAALSMLRGDVRLPGDVRDDLEMVSRNIDLEVRLIADLLDVSRALSGKMHLERRATDVAHAIREAVRIVSGDLHARGQALTIETPGAPYLAFADAARLQQVFWNLLRNAVKFSPERSRIAIRAKVLPVEQCPLVAERCPVGMGDCPLHQAVDGDGRPCGANLVVEVTDHGSGIAADLLPRLFTPFVQERIEPTVGGLGLGLSICKAVVELHGGTISAHSDGVGRGATFTVRLPVAQCPLSGEAPARPAGHAQPGTDDSAPAASHPLRVLLVEDHADTARLMRRLLVKEGHEVTTAGSVADGVAAVWRAEPDVLISDVGLPDGSGLDLLRQLAAEGYRIPAIALSGYGAPADIEKSRAAGFAEHLVKPLNGAAPLTAAIARLGLAGGRRGRDRG